MKPGFLLDRDGVLIEEVDFLSRASDVHVVAGAARAVARLNAAGIPVALCTNQPVVARGDVTPQQLDQIHAVMKEQLAQNGGAKLDALYVCPHHPNPETPRPNKAFCFSCDCRKPLPGLLLQARDRLGLDLLQTVMVGDRSTDVEAARRAGAVAVGVLTGKHCQDARHVIPPEVPLLTDAEAAARLVLDLVPSWRTVWQPLLNARVILLGGPSRTGKTTAATALVLAVRSVGKTVVHLSLDRWILAASQRPAQSTVKQRMQFDRAQADVTSLLRHGTVVTPGYDALTREAAPEETVTLPRDAVLVLDGLLAPLLSVDGAVKVALHQAEEVLKERRARLYAWKRVTAEQARERVDGLDEERDAVARAVDAASLHFTLDESWTLRPFPVDKRLAE